MKDKFFFDADSITPGQIRSLRKTYDSRKFSKAKTAGEGYANIAGSIMTGLANRKLNKAEKTGRERASALFDDLVRGNDPTPFSSDTGPLSVLGMKPQGYDDFNASLSKTESGGNYNVTNSEGYGGKYQFGQERLDDFNRANGTQYQVSDLTAGTPEAAQLTESVQNWHVGDIDNFVTQNGLDQYVGQNIGGVDITMNGLRGMAHLGGKGGMQKFLQTNGQYNPSDSNGTSLSDYGTTHGGGGSRQPAPDMSQLYAALSDPWLDQSQRAVITQMIQQQTQANDPLRQIQLQKAQLDLDQARNPQPDPREREKDANGRLRFVDDGSYVFDDLGDSAQTLDFDGESKLRKEYTGLPSTKAFSEQSQAYGRIVASADDPSPAGDLALVFNFMKVLDPGSVVRESEFATAESAAAWLQQSEEAGLTVPRPVASAIRRMATGQRLAPEQRRDFVGRASKIYDQAETQSDQGYDDWAIRAGEYGMSPERVLPDFRYRPEGAPPTSVRPQARPGTPEPQRSPQETRGGIGRVELPDNQFSGLSAAEILEQVDGRDLSPAEQQALSAAIEYLEGAGQ